MQLLNLDLKLVLASKSPRRIKLLKQLGFEFIVLPSNLIEDKLTYSSNTKDYAMQSAYKKANDIAQGYEEKAIVLGADTIVVLKNTILHKPKDEEDAIRILKMLSNNTHTVFTGVALIESISGRKMIDVQSTEVTFRDLTDKEIIAYVNTGSPMDKAGAYGIQDDFGAVFVSHINGCYYNIVGLPLEMLYIMMRKFLNRSEL